VAYLGDKYPLNKQNKRQTTKDDQLIYFEMKISIRHNHLVNCIKNPIMCILWQVITIKGHESITLPFLPCSNNSLC